MRYGSHIAPAALGAEERHHGLVALNLIGQWDGWIKRRVESIEFINDTTVVRKVSVDFRMRSWLPEPILTWDSCGIHYVPIALLDKQPLLNFDLRDEAGRALPLLTRRRNAAIAAATLVALSQLTIWVKLGRLVGFDELVADGSHYPNNPRNIAIPRGIEDDFVRIAYLPFAHNDAAGAGRLMQDFLGSAPSHLRPVPDWGWHKDGDQWQSSEEEALWRYELGRDSRFRSLLSDFARLWMVSVPIKHEVKQRRIVKFSYSEHRIETQLGILSSAKSVVDSKGLGRWLGRQEDRLEGMPTDPISCAEWDPHFNVLAPPDRISVSTSLKRALAWNGHQVKFAAPAVGEGGSYHLELRAPDGTQIRRATLIASCDEEITDIHGMRGARGLQQAHLYVGDVPAGSQGIATVILKPRSATIVRSIAFLALASFVMLLAARLRIDALTDRTQGPSGAIAPLFLLFPGLGAAAIARGSEHSMTTSMLFGLRLTACIVAVFPLCAAALLAIARRWPHIEDAWTCLVAGSGVMALLLLVSWRLAGRRRPDGSSP